VQAAIAWVFGPQQEQQRWQQAVWQAGGLEGQSATLEDATQRQAAILAQARAADPPRPTAPLSATPPTSPSLAEADWGMATRQALLQQAILAEQQRQYERR